MRSRRVPAGGPRPGGSARGDAPHCDALGDLVAQLGHVGDDADGAPAGAQVVDLGHDRLEGVGVQGAEALVDEEGLQAHAPGLGRDDVGQGEGQ